MRPSHVLVPLDGSPLADEALAHALAVFDCEVTVLNVVTPIDAGMSEGQLLDPDDEREAAARERAEALIETAVDRARDADRDADREVRTAIETGDPAATIVEYVETHDIDQVVMGGHGGDRGAIARRLLGTVATAVVGDAPVTVTVVRESPTAGADRGDASADAEHGRE
jgi:nucleotide-binding universal stress UspA family protein